MVQGSAKRVNFDEWLKDFEDAGYPTTILSGIQRLNNPKKFVETHISILRANSGNKAFKPYYDRLKEYREWILKTRSKE